jgi:hypothetical protein
MGNVFHAYDHDYEIYVEQIGNMYHVVKKSYTAASPVVLHAYAGKEEAIASARIFPKLHRIAVQRGYQLDGQFFRHSDGRSVHVSFAMEPGMSADRFMKLLMN